jgi:hypothetical protein
VLICKQINPQERVMPTTTQPKTKKVKKTGSRYVDSALDLERRLAAMTRQEWLKGLIETQADLAFKVLHR